MAVVAASGVALYEQHADMIEKIVTLKAQRCVRFPGENWDDAAQKIRLICFEALKKFDPDKVGKSVYHFLARCVDNGLFNEYRGTYLDNNPPYTRCEELDCGGATCECDKMVQYRQRMQRKRSIASPISYCVRGGQGDNDEGINHEMLGQLASKTGLLDLDEHIKAHLDPTLINYYEFMKTGDHRCVPLNIRRKIQRTVRSILLENVDGNQDR